MKSETTPGLPMSALSTVLGKVISDFEAKAERRKQLAALPPEEKVEIMEKLRDTGLELRKSRVFVRAPLVEVPRANPPRCPKCKADALQFQHDRKGMYCKCSHCGQEAS